jgi:hypothetical protein
LPHHLPRHLPRPHPRQLPTHHPCHLGVMWQVNLWRSPFVKDFGLRAGFTGL